MKICIAALACLVLASALESRDVLGEFGNKRNLYGGSSTDWYGELFGGDDAGSTAVTDANNGGGSTGSVVASGSGGGNIEINGGDVDETSFGDTISDAFGDMSDSIGDLFGGDEAARGEGEAARLEESFAKALSIAALAALLAFFF